MEDSSVKKYRKQSISREAIPRDRFKQIRYTLSSNYSLAKKGINELRVADADNRGNMQRSTTSIRSLKNFDPFGKQKYSIPNGFNGLSGEKKVNHSYVSRLARSIKSSLSSIPDLSTRKIHPFTQVNFRVKKPPLDTSVKKKTRNGMFRNIHRKNVRNTYENHNSHRLDFGSLKPNAGAIPKSLRTSRSFERRTYSNSRVAPQINTQLFLTQNINFPKNFNSNCLEMNPQNMRSSRSDGFINFTISANAKNIKNIMEGAESKVHFLTNPNRPSNFSPNLNISLDFGEDEMAQTNKVLKNEMRSKVQNGIKPNSVTSSEITPIRPRMERPKDETPVARYLSNPIVNKTVMKQNKSKLKILDQLKQIKMRKKNLQPNLRSNRSGIKSMLNIDKRSNRSRNSDFKFEAYAFELKDKSRKKIFDDVERESTPMKTRRKKIFTSPFHKMKQALTRSRMKTEQDSSMMPKMSERPTINISNQAKYENLFKTFRNRKKANSKFFNQQLGEKIFKKAGNPLSGQEKKIKLMEDIENMKRELKQTSTFIVENQHETDIELEQVVTFQQVRSEIENYTDMYRKLSSFNHQMKYKLQEKYNALYSRKKRMLKLKCDEDLLRININFKQLYKSLKKKYEDKIDKKCVKLKQISKKQLEVERKLLNMRFANDPNLVRAELNRYREELMKRRKALVASNRNIIGAGIKNSIVNLVGA